ncbi:MAG TPA: Xaa-Pro peptidase family protein [Solirubrobacteraceae bacterium]
MAEAPFPHSEYEERWRRAQAAAIERELDGLLVWSKGGGPVDTCADVLYLANHVSPFPLIADIPGHWIGRAHAAVVLPSEGEPTLVVDLPDWRRDLVPVEDVRFSLDVPGEVAAVLAERGLADGRLGLVGGNAMLVSPYRHLLSSAPAAELVEADDLVEALRADKSPRELDLLRAAADAGNAVVTAMMETALKPGSTEAEAIAAGYAVAVARGVATYDAAVASGPNSDFYSYGRLPSWTTRTLEQGDFFHVDTYGALDGYLYDFARCCVVGGRPSADQREVLEAVIDAVHAGTARIRPGVRARELYEAVHGVLVRRGMTGTAENGELVSALDVSFPAHGHSFGLGWERPWLVPDEDTEVRAGMCFGIEAMAGRAGVGSAKFEQDVIVTADGAELLTTIPTHYW